ncbi:MAG TPA: DUF4403 family protein, partial [Flavisolibacter sp.]
MRYAYFVILVLASTNMHGQQAASPFLMDSLPESRIDIPIQISLRPVFAMAEKNVDTIFTSPGYPDGWIQSDCATRYKYRFRRSPLRMQVQGTTLHLGFTGFYRIIGATRVCVNGNVLSPWSPSCRCGYDEPERRVQVGFTANFQLQPDHLLRTRITRHEPKALDKCEVCFWGQDVTNEVMKGLKEELDLSRKAIEDSFSTYNLRPLLQQAWNQLSDVYALPGVGYFSLNPKKLRMNQFAASNDMLHISIGISATPVVSSARPPVVPSPVPNLSQAANAGGFNIHLEAALQYDSLSQVMNTLLAGKRFDFSEGLFKKHVIITGAAVSGNEEGDLVIRADFTGSFAGTAYFSGKPAYDSATQSIIVQDLDYDLRTKNLLLKTAGWLFSSRITSELKKYSAIPMAPY